MTRTSDPDFESGTLNPYQICGDEIEPGDRYGYKIVAVIYSWGGWGAYRGPTGWSDNQVADSGDAILFEAARHLFPTLAESGRIYSP